MNICMREKKREREGERVFVRVCVWESESATNKSYWSICMCDAGTYV